MKYIFIVILSLVLVSCNESQTKTFNADEIIDTSIEASGMDKLKISNITFDFRDVQYLASRNNGRFELQRKFKDSTGNVHDYLKNKGFERYINDTLVKLSDTLSAKYSA